LFQVLGDVGDRVGQEELATERRLLARAAPQAVPSEPWFAELTGMPVGSPADDGSTPRAESGPAPATAAVVWEGDQLVIHSLAHVNRQVCQRLLERGRVVSLWPSSNETDAPTLPSAWRLLAKRFRVALPRPAEVHVRHQWPPNFQPPPAGRWVMMQPWEFGSLPKAWIEPILRHVDDVWVPSRFVRDCFVRCGIPAERVQVIPLGADPELFRPDVPALALPTRKRYKFLFVGGTIQRKGIDVLLDAYTRAFHRGDDVCLVIKDMGVGTFYRGQTAEARIAEIQAAAASPEIVYLNQELA